MKVFGIVVTYNGEKWIDKCFGSLSDSSVTLQILAIDNASSDNTVALIKSQFPDVDVIETGSNLGFGKANNIGLKKALLEGADYVFLLNQDAWVENTTLETLIEIARSNPEFGIISPVHLLPDKKKLEWHFSCYIGAEYCPGFVSDLYCNQVKEIYELPVVNAAAWLINKTTLRLVGGFDPIFPHYGEDDDYCNRVGFKNLKIGVSPRAKIVHDITMKSWNEIKQNPTRQMIFNFIELKNLNSSYRYLKFNFVKTRLERLLTLIFTRRWKELIFMTKIFFKTIVRFRLIAKSRKHSLEETSFLN